MDRSAKGNEKRPVTASDVARAAGVSQSTVSRAFAENAGPPPKKKDLILQVARELGYHPNAFARALAANRSGIIAMIASGLEDTFLSKLLCGLVESLQERNLQLLMFSLEDERQIPDILEKLHQYHVDGMISTSVFLKAETVYRFSEMCRPIIMLNRFVPAPYVKGVCCDNAAGAGELVKHLVSLGKRRIALLSGAPQSYTAQSRAKGFLAQMEALGIAPAAQIQTATTHRVYESGRAAMERLLERSPGLDAVLCTNDMLAFGAMDAVRGSTAKGGIAVAGFDGHPFAGRPSYDLTTVEQPLETLIREAVDTLCQMLEAAEPAGDCRFYPGRLVVRSSTREGVFSNAR